MCHALIVCFCYRLHRYACCSSRAIVYPCPYVVCCVLSVLLCWLRVVNSATPVSRRCSMHGCVVFAVYYFVICCLLFAVYSVHILRIFCYIVVTACCVIRTYITCMVCRYICVSACLFIYVGCLCVRCCLFVVRYIPTSNTCHHMLHTPPRIPSIMQYITT